MEKIIKVTKAMQYAEILTFIPVERQDLIERIQKDIEMASRKSSGARKMTPNQIENEATKQNILASLEGVESLSVKELLAIPEIAEKCGTSTQKIAALLTALVKSGLIVKTMDKKTSRYSLVQ